MGKTSIDKLADKFVNRYIDHYSDDEETELLAQSMNSDGSWSDLDYEGKNLPFWRCVNHFERLNYLAVSKKYDDKVILGLKFWYKVKRTDPNWWWNEIGIPMKLAVSGILLKDKFDPELKKIVCEAFNDSILDKWTGTNRTWFAQNVVVRGIISGDAELIRRGKKYLEDTVFISNTLDDGIQYDFAFAQHGPQLYNNGYGHSMVTDNCKWIEIFEGTEFEFDKEKEEIITSLLLDGHGHMCFMNVADYNTIGRDIVRGYKGRDSRIDDYLSAIETLKKVSDRKEELESLSEFIKGNPRAIERTKMFSSLNIMTGVHNGGYASVRFGSDKVLGGDVIDGKIINDEDRLSGFRGCFATQYMVSGNEYDRVFPLWNWAFIPGVSCPEVELRTERGAVMQSSFAGGASDGMNGVCGIDLNEDFSKDEETVVFGGKKACFIIGNDIIHLGYGLYSKTNLNTTVNQCNFEGSFIADGIKYGYDKFRKNVNYILHGNIGYVFPTETELCVSAEHIEGEWNKITQIAETMPASGDVFKAYIPHNNSDSYEYAVLLNADEEALKNYKLPTVINTEKLQAVKKGDVICAVIYESGSYNIEDKNIICDRPCFAVIKGNEITASKTVDDKDVNITCN